MGDAEPTQPSENRRVAQRARDIRSRGSGIVKRVRTRVDDVTTKATAIATAARKRYRHVETAFQTYDRDKRAVGNVLAGAVAFRLFVYLLPLALALLTILGIIAGFNPSEPQQLVHQSGLGKSIVDSVSTATASSKKSLWILVPLSLYALYSGGRGVLKVLHAIHAVAWGEPLTKMRRGVSAAFALFGVALGLLVVVLLLQWIHKQVGGLGLVATLMTTVVYIGAWLAASRALPHGDAPWQALLPGAIVVGVGVEALHLVSLFYLGSKIASASETYGSLGAAAAIIAWLYLIGRLFVASAMLNATMWERREARAGASASSVAPGRRRFGGRVLTLGGESGTAKGDQTLVDGAATGEDGLRKPRTERR
jgi:uncharacterized BrkB/YihY/UPF0761 family membrane protein